MNMEEMKEPSALVHSGDTFRTATLSSLESLMSKNGRYSPQITGHASLEAEAYFHLKEKAYLIQGTTPGCPTGSHIRARGLKL